MARRTKNDMRKIYLILAIAGIMMTTACSNENNEPVITTDEANVTFSVNLNDIDSRVISDGTTVDQLIFSVFDSEGNEITSKRQNNVPVSNCHATVTTRLQLGRGFTFVFWAQKSGNAFYTTTNLKDIVVSYAGEANDENRDAFTATYSIAKVTQDFTQDVTLRRPFAQVDYVCSLDEWTDLMNSNRKLIGSNLVVEAGAYTHYNAFTGEASVPTTTPITFAMSDWWYQNYDNINGFCSFVTTRNGNGYDNLFDGEKFWLSMNYILATPEVTNLGKTTMNIYGVKNYDPIAVPIEVNELPIQRNHRTVVNVSNLTTTVSVIIDKDPEMGDDPE